MSRIFLNSGTLIVSIRCAVCPLLFIAELCSACPEQRNSEKMREINIIITAFKKTTFCVVRGLPHINMVRCCWRTALKQRNIKHFLHLENECKRNRSILTKDGDIFNRGFRPLFWPRKKLFGSLGIYCIRNSGKSAENCSVF